MKEQPKSPPNNTQGGLNCPWAASSSMLVSVWEQIHLGRTGLWYHRVVWPQTASMGIRAVAHHTGGQNHRVEVPTLHI